MFFLKKAAGFLLMPLPAAMVLLLVGTLLLFAGRKRHGRALAALALLILGVFSNERVSLALLAPLEARYPSAPAQISHAQGPIAGCAYVAVLGGGQSEVESLPALSRLSTSALGRIAEAVRIMRGLPAAKLIVSGPGPEGRPSHAQVLAEAAESLGVDRSRIILISDAHDTEDESRAVARIAGNDPVALVTSAWHMPRAMRLFREAGVDALACPADYKAKSDESAGEFLVWNSDSLERSTFAIHEWLGLAWLRLRGR